MNIIIKITLASLILLFSFSTYAQPDPYVALNIPATLKENANEVVRLQQMHFEIENPKLATYKFRRVVTILNDKSYANVQYVSYDSHIKLSKLSARVYDMLGNEIRKIKEKDFQDRSAVSGSTMYSDSRYKYTELNHNAYPYTVEIEYTLIFKRIPFYPTMYLNSFGRSVEKASYKISTPKDMTIRYQAKNIDLKPNIERSDKNTVYTWTTENLPAIKYEPKLPNTNQLRPIVRVAPTTFLFDNYKGDMSNWNSFGKFMYEINKGRDVLSPVMKNKVQELVREVESDREKIEILYRYLQENMRYVSVQLGIGGWQTFDAAYVESNKYGDCKALSNFMKALLKEAGIEAHQALIYSDRDDKIILDSTFAFPNFANHVIIRVPEENIWLECTSTSYPVNYIGRGNGNRQALMYSEQGGTIINTPALAIEDNSKQSSFDIVIDEHGATTIKETTQLKGYKQDYLRYIKHNYDQKDLEEAVLELYDLPAFDLEKFEITPHIKQPICDFNLEIYVPRYASKAGKRIFVPLNRLAVFDDVPDLIEDRIHPIQVNNTYRENQTFNFILPGSYELESLPKKEILLESKEFGKYQVSIEVNENSVTYTRSLEIYSIDLEPDRYNELRDFYKEIAKFDNMKMVLVKKKA